MGDQPQPRSAERRPPRPVLLFDGACGFCTWTVEWLRRRPRRPVDAVPWQRADLGRFGLSREQADRYVWWIDESGARHRGHRAVVQALSACAAPWPRIGALLGSCPLAPFAALAYRAISALRPWLPGIRPACSRSAG